VWVGARLLDFSDGNRREQARLAWAERIAETPTWKLTLRPEIYASRNTRKDAPYFNPARDTSVSMAVDADGLLWRNYEASLRQRLVVRAGNYRQEGYASGWIGGVSYEQSWQPGPRFELRYGIEFGRARYDGVNESVGIVFLVASGRF
jgi:biofilm PGA synthesis protein PgaA